jgi:hypothetical protein
MVKKVIVVECTKCKKKISESALFVTEKGKRTKVCVPCAKAIIDEREKESFIKPKFMDCARCGKKKVWPVDFPNGGNKCTICIKKDTKPVPANIIEGTKKWRENNPDKVAEQNRLKRERMAAKRKADIEKARKTSKLAAKRHRLKVRLIKKIKLLKREEQEQQCQNSESDTQTPTPEKQKK